MCGSVLSHVWLFCHHMNHQASQSVEFSRQEYWSGLPKNKNWDSCFLSKSIDSSGVTFFSSSKRPRDLVSCHHHGKHHLVKLCAGGIFLTVQWLGFLASTIESTGLIPGWGVKTPHASQPRQINCVMESLFWGALLQTPLSECPDSVHFGWEGWGRWRREGTIIWDLLLLLVAIWFPQVWSTHDKFLLWTTLAETRASLPPSLWS